MQEDRIIRSLLLDIAKPVDPKLLIDNFFYLAGGPFKLDWQIPQNKVIWDYIESFITKYQEAPKISSLKEYYAEQGDVEVLSHLENLSVQPVATKADFCVLTQKVHNTQQEIACTNLFRDAVRILSEGVSLRKGREDIHYKGHQDAIRYILEHADRFLTVANGQRIQGNILEDAEELLQNFELAMNAPEQAWGRLTGLEPIDQVSRGLKAGELWIHAGHTGELKTTFALNWAYKTACVYRYNVAYVSMEMPYDQVRLTLAVMHSANPKFIQQGMQPLSYSAIRDGVNKDGSPLTAETKEYYEYIVRDLESGEYGDIWVWSPEGNVKPSQIKQRLEIRDKQSPIDMAVLDHLGLIVPENRTKNPYADINSVMRDVKMMALHFNEGAKLPILGLIQTNREGKKEADKNNGIYRTSALADANEAERSADVITYTYLNAELRQAQQVKVGCLKNRDNPHFHPFTVSINWDSKYMGHSINVEDHLTVIPTTHEAGEAVFADMMGNTIVNRGGNTIIGM